MVEMRDIKSRIEGSLNSISTSSYRYISLLLMYLRKKNALYLSLSYKDIDDVIASVEFTDVKGKYIYVIGRNLREDSSVSDILQIFKDFGDNFSAPCDADKSVVNNKLMSVATSLTGADDQWIADNISGVFEMAVRKFQRDKTSLNVPTDLIRFVDSFIDKDVHFVYNPYTDLCDFSCYLKQNVKYVGGALNSISFAISKLRLLINEQVGVIRLNKDLSLDRVALVADCIISMPPFLDNRRVMSDYYRMDDKTSSMYEFCFNNKKKGLFLIPASYLRGKYINDQFHKGNILDTVVLLPKGLMHDIGVTFAVIYINPFSNHPNAIRLINASNLKVNTEKNGDLLEWEYVNELISDDSTLIPLDTIRENDYNLDPLRYFEEPIDIQQGSQIIPLGNLGEFQKTEINKGVSRELVANRFRGSKILKTYGPDDFEEEDLGHWAHRLPDECIIINTVLGISAYHVKCNGKVLFAYERTVFIPDQAKILPLYLVSQLNADYVKKQTNSPLFDSSESRLREIKIAVPPIAEQKAMIEQAQARALRSMGDEIQALKTKQFDEYEKNMHLRKHALKQILNDVLPAARRVANFVSSQEGDFNKHTVVASRNNATLEDYTQRLYANVDRLTRLVSSLTDDVEDEKSVKAERIHIVEFINEYVKTKFHEKYTLTWNQNMLDSMMALEGDESANRDLVMFPKKKLEVLFDNIISNAEAHGFTDEKRTDYEIAIRFSNEIVDKDLYAEIRILNNGNKLPVGMTSDKVFCWGETSGNGTGLGSWQAKNIVEKRGGRIELKELNDDPDGFTIEYRVLIPLEE